jgi:hypothetical protein
LKKEKRGIRTAESSELLFACIVWFAFMLFWTGADRTRRPVMEWSSVISSILAGGLAGQMSTIFIGNQFTRKRDLLNWTREERFKLFSELVALVASTSPECGYDKWPGQVRALCQRVFLLYPDGNPPESLKTAMEATFRRCHAKKLGKVEDEDKWRQDLRTDADILRTELAKALHSGLRRRWAFLKPQQTG